MQGSAQEKKKDVFQPEKRSRFQKNYRRRHPTPLRARTNITPQTYGTEEVLVLLLLYYYYCYTYTVLLRYCCTTTTIYQVLLLYITTGYRIHRRPPFTHLPCTTVLYTDLHHEVTHLPVCGLH